MVNLPKIADGNNFPYNPRIIKNFLNVCNYTVSPNLVPFFSSKLLPYRSRPFLAILGKGNRSDSFCGCLVTEVAHKKIS